MLHGTVALFTLRQMYGKTGFIRRKLEGNFRTKIKIKLLDKSIHIFGKIIQKFVNISPILEYIHITSMAH